MARKKRKRRKKRKKREKQREKNERKISSCRSKSHKNLQDFHLIFYNKSDRIKTDLHSIKNPIDLLPRHCIDHFPQHGHRAKFLTFYHKSHNSSINNFYWVIFCTIMVNYIIYLQLKFGSSKQFKKKDILLFHHFFDVTMSGHS